MYYVMEGHTPKDGPEEIKMEPLEHPLDWGLGRRLKEPLPRVTLTYPTLEKLQDVWWTGVYLVMRRSFLDFVVAIGESHFEHFPIRVVSTSGKEDRDTFSIVHLIDTVACMDLNASEFTRFQSGGIFQISRLILHEDKIPPDRHLFPMAESKSVYLASSRLKEEFEGRGVRGAKFVRLEDILF